MRKMPAGTELYLSALLPQVRPSFERKRNAWKNALCRLSEKRRSPFRLSRSALYYDDASKNLILAFKFMDKTENARLLAAMMKVAGEDIFAAGVDLIVPVPLHYTRLVKRRYNQSALMAYELGRYTSLPVDCFSLVRHKKTRPQVEFSGAERVKTLKTPFR